MLVKLTFLINVRDSGYDSMKQRHVNVSPKHLAPHSHRAPRPEAFSQEEGSLMGKPEAARLAQADLVFDPVDGRMSFRGSGA